MDNSEFLNETIERLNNQLDSFKKGQEIVAMDMTGVIRMIVHTTKKSTSFLKQIGKETITFLSTLNIDWEKGVSFRVFEDGCKNITYMQDLPFPSGLLGAITRKDKSTKYVPLIHTGQKITHLCRMVDFNEWWENENIGIINGKYYNRKTIILSLANKGGAVHLDDKGPQHFEEFKKRSVSGININGSVVNTMNYPLFSIICEIAFELLESIKNIII